MGLELTFHQTTSISAEAITPAPDPNLGATAWVNMAFHTKDGQSFTLTAFFSDNPALARVYADAINGAGKSPEAVNLFERYQQMCAEVDAVRKAITAYHSALDMRKHGGLAAAQAVDAIQDALKMPWVQGATIQPAPVTEESCPGHIASEADPKVCARCGTHIDSLRPDNGDIDPTPGVRDPEDDYKNLVIPKELF